MSPCHRCKFYFVNHLPSEGIACTRHVSNSGRKSRTCLVRDAMWSLLMGGLFRSFRIPHAWSCVVTISSISAIDILMETSINLASVPHAGLKNSSLSSEFKLKAVRFAEDCNSNRKGATKFGVDRKRIREWRQKKSKLEAVNSKRSGSREPEESHLMKTSKNHYYSGCVSAVPMAFVWSQTKQNFSVKRNSRRKKTTFVCCQFRLVTAVHVKIWLGNQTQNHWIIEGPGENRLPRQRYHDDGRDSSMAGYGI